MLKAKYNQQPTAITYMGLPSREADVWLRKNIHEVEEPTEEGHIQTFWECNEVYFRTELTEAEVTDNFDDLYLKFSHLEPTLAERVNALEEVVLELLGG